MLTIQLYDIIQIYGLLFKLACVENGKIYVLLGPSSEAQYVVI